MIKYIELFYALNYPFYIGIMFIVCGVALALIFIIYDIIEGIIENIKYKKNNEYTTDDAIADNVNFKMAFIKSGYIINDLKTAASQIVYASYSGDERYISTDYLMEQCASGCIETLRREKQSNITREVTDFQVLDAKIVKQKQGLSYVEEIDADVSFHISYIQRDYDGEHSSSKDFVQTFTFRYIGESTWKLVTLSEERPYVRKPKKVFPYPSLKMEEN